MGLIYKSMDKLRIDAGKSVSFPAIQGTYGRLTTNDKAMAGQDIAPGIWLNPLYPGVVSEGYSKGQAVWINIYRIDDFVHAYQMEIEGYARHDTQLDEMFNQLSSPNFTSERFDLCKQVVEGYGADGPLYYLGNPLAPAQVMVSLSDDNVKPPTDSDWWKPFIKCFDAKETHDRMLSVFSARTEQIFIDHAKEYHLSGVYSSSQQLDAKYMLNDMSNVVGSQKFKSHYWYVPTATGYDRVKFYDQRQTGEGRFKWVRVWESGFVEHGGIVSLDDPDGDDTYQDGLYTVRFRQQTTSGKYAPCYDYPMPGFRRPYGDEPKYSVNGADYAIPDALFNPEMSYTVRVTPINCCSVPYGRYNAQARAYDQADVCFVLNDGFSFVPSNEDVREYSYVARGYSQQTRKF